MQKIDKAKEAQKRLLRLALARINFKDFLLLKWESFNKKPFIDSWHYDYLCKILQHTLPQNLIKNNNQTLLDSNIESKTQIKRLILNMPPSYGKTEIIARSFIPFALGIDRSRKFIYISYSDDLCKKINTEIRAVMKSKFWSNVFKEPPRFLKESAQEIILEQGGGLFVTTVKGAITGFHAHQVLIDDPIKVSNMNSKVERDKVNDTLRNIVTRLQDTNSNITILMQRLGEEDLCGFLLNEKEFDKDIIKEWNHIKLQAINKEKEIYTIDNFRYEREANEPLFKAKHDLKELEEMRLSLGEDEFSTQYQQEPQASEAGFFDSVYFKEIPFYEVGETRDYIFVDNAVSVNEKADNRAIVTISLENYQNSTRYIVRDCKYGIWAEQETINNLIATMQEFKNASVYIESDGGGLTLERLLQREIVIINEKLKRKDKELISNTINVYVASRKVPKVEKIKAIRSYYNTGYLVFKHGMNNLNQIKKELLAFNPEKPFRKDDCIDCIASCIAHKDCLPPPKIESNIYTSPRQRYYNGYTTRHKGWRI